MHFLSLLHITQFKGQEKTNVRMYKDNMRGITFIGGDRYFKFKLFMIRNKQYKHINIIYGSQKVDHAQFWFDDFLFGYDLLRHHIHIKSFIKVVILFLIIDNCFFDKDKHNKDEATYYNCKNLNLK